MKFNKSYKMMPILIGLSTNYALAKTELLFSESKVIKDNYFDIAKATIVAQHELNITSAQFQKIKFEEYYNKWNINTMFYSNPKMIIEDENFQNILNMGEQVIPLIIQKIKTEPSQLVWALNIITKKKISKNSITTIEDACKLWVKLYR